MKKFLIISFIVVNSFWAGAQDIALSVTTEYTVAGHQYGANLMVETNKLWGAGIFYQGELYNHSEVSSIKDIFYGATVQVPLVYTPKLSFVANLRGGLVNKQFWVLVPGIETRVNLNKRLALGFGMSMRMNYPSVSSRLIVKLF